MMNDQENTVPRGLDSPVKLVKPKLEEPPLNVSALSGVQPLEFDNMPIDDDEFVPTTGVDLGRACRLLLGEVPDEAVAWLWKQIRRLHKKVNADIESSATGGVNIKYESTSFANDITSIIIEGPGQRHDMFDIDAYVDSIDTPLSKMRELPDDSSYVDYKLSKDDADMLDAIDAADVADVVKKRKNVTAGEEGAQLGDIAKVTGMAGPAGVKNMLYRIEDKLKYFASLDEIWFRDMMREFAIAYVEELRDSLGPDIEPADLKFLNGLMKHPDTVIRDNSFRVWAQEYLTKIVKNKLGKRSSY